MYVLHVHVHLIQVNDRYIIIENIKEDTYKITFKLNEKVI